MSEAVINVGYLFLRRRKGKGKGIARSQKERKIWGAVECCSENPSVQIDIKQLPQNSAEATICFHCCVRGNEKAGKNAVSLVWVTGATEMKNSHKM